MTATCRYIHWDGATFDVDLGDAVRLGSIGGFNEIAEMGAAGSSTIVLDDPDADLGHSGDHIRGLQQFAYDDDAAAEARIFMGWTNQRTYRRGEDSLRQGAMRKIEVSLDDGNILAGRRILKPKSEDATVDRPAETPAARIAWLLGTDYFSGVVDNGLVHPKTSPMLTANDFSGQNPADVMNDACTATGDNWFVRWNRADAVWELCVFNFTTYSGDAGTLILSNDIGLVDSNLEDGAGPTNTWAVSLDAALVIDPSTVATGVLYADATGSVYVDTTLTDYPLVDHTASSTAVKDATLATAKANRYLADNALEAHRITCTAQIAAANVNDAYAGQLIIASFIHLPGYETASYFRIARRTVAQPALIDDFYTCTYELVPASPVSPSSGFAVLDRAFIAAASAQSTGTFLMSFSGTGDTPPVGSSYAVQPKVGLVDYDAGGVISPGIATGIKFLGAGTDIAFTISTQSNFVFDFGSPGGSTFQMLAKIGSTVVGSSSILTDTGTGLHSYGAALSISVSGITVANGDILEIYYVIGVTAPHSGSVPSSGTFAPPYQLVVTGTLA